MFKNKKSNLTSKKQFLEPIIVSGKYFNIKLLSAYDFMLCTKNYDDIKEKLIKQNFDKKLCENICQYACVATLCLYNFKSQKVFDSPMEALKSLTPYELFLIYSEYKKLQRKILQRDKISYNILEKVRKNECGNNKLEFLQSKNK